MNQKFWAKQAKLITDTSAILDLSGVLGGEEGGNTAIGTGFKVTRRRIIGRLKVANLVRLPKSSLKQLFSSLSMGFKHLIEAASQKRYSGELHFELSKEVNLNKNYLLVLSWNEEL